MAVKEILLAILLSILVLSHLVSAFPTNQTIEWKPCEPSLGKNSSKLEYDCGTLIVPLDYTELEYKQELKLKLIRVKATKQPSKGSILYNPGGPGLPAREKLPEDGPMLLWLSGEQYDIVTFDPRGTGDTVPFKCGSLESYNSMKDTATNSEEIWKATGDMVKQCFRKQGKSKRGKLMGTAFTARDLMEIVDALREDGLLRFWGGGFPMTDNQKRTDESIGFSYGTVIGATVAAMFPDRIDKMVIDGVVNPHDWYNSPYDVKMTKDTDKILSRIFKICFDDGKVRCPLGRRSKTPQALEELIWARLEDLRTKPIIQMRNGYAYKVHYKYFAQLMRSSIVNQARWPKMLDAIDRLLDIPGSKAYTEWLGRRAVDDAETPTPTPTPKLPPKVVDIVGPHLAVRCGDKFYRMNNFKRFKHILRIALDSSKLSGRQFAAISAVCAQWQMHAREVYEGDFKVKTKGPVLVASAELDPRTPLVSAKNISATLEGSEVLVVEGAGHCSVSIPSSCAAKHFRDYWMEGKMPSKGTKCKAEPSDKGWVDVLTEWRSKAHHQRDMDGLVDKQMLGEPFKRMGDAVGFVFTPEDEDGITF
ncbi:hypothetical protein ACHAQA_004583 [Verticillium albo-atrum]